MSLEASAALEFPARKNLVCGAGGSRAILANAGLIMACDIAGIKEWQTIGGVSGGSVPALALAAGIDPRDIMQLVVDIDFASLIPRHATPISTVVAFILKDRFEYTRPKKGVLGSEKMGSFVESLVPEWPANFWTMGVVARTQVLFTADGVYQYLKNGQRRVLSTTPAPVGVAIRATCAIPGVIDAVQYKGRHLLDGALSWDGPCPVGIATRHFGERSEDVIACDVGKEEGRLSPIFRALWAFLCGDQCVTNNEILPIPDDVLMMRPSIRGVKSLEFKLSAEQKWGAVHAGFQEAVLKLSRSGLLTGAALVEANELAADIEALKALTTSR